LDEISLVDDNVFYIRNAGPNRVGHTILYDKLVTNVAKYDLCMIYHADMYLAPGALDAIESHMYSLVHTDHVPGGFEWVPNEKTIVSLTRIEPPLHPPGPEKITRDFGTEPEDFNDAAFLEDLKQHPSYIKDKTTSGVFAPWAFWKSEFLEIGGHDWLYAPQSKEDSDIFNRFHLNGIKFIQTWEGFVYHMTCRGNRRNTLDGAPNITVNNPEWEIQNIKSSRNFIRKWGHFVKHDEYMQPIVPPKYDIGILLESGGIDLLNVLEPWCSKIYVDRMYESAVKEYIANAQVNTRYDLNTRIGYLEESSTHDVLITINPKTFTDKEFNLLNYINEIIAESGVTSGTFELENLKISISKLEDHAPELIHIDNSVYQ
jgi:hypothetical protein